MKTPNQTQAQTLRHLTRWPERGAWVVATPRRAYGGRDPNYAHPATLRALLDRGWVEPTPGQQRYLTHTPLRITRKGWRALDRAQG